MRTMNGSIRRKAKTGVSYGWAYPVTPKRSMKSSFRTLLKYCKLYCKYSSLVGFKYLTEDHTTWIERILWALALAITLSSLIILVRSAHNEFLVNPMATTVDADYIPTHELEFPGVAICSINRISRMSAMEMATELFSTLNDSSQTVEHILDLIADLGDLYESGYLTEERYDDIDQLLLRFHNGQYDVTDIMKRLTPTCSAGLSVCFFRGEQRNCSEIFAFRKTQDGFCCTFNYAREPDDLPMQADPEAMEVLSIADLGIDRGLSVVMEPFKHDYFYTILPIFGWKVTIFNPRDYPDTTSGGVSEVLVSPKSESYIELDALSFYSTNSTESYTPEKRGCIFAEEMRKMQMAMSYSDCIVECKTEDIWRSCACIPFYFPRRGPQKYSRKVCNTMDIPCLARHKSKWYNVVPHSMHEIDSDVTNATWALHCYNCYPKCDDVSYIVRSSVSYIESGTYRTNLLNHVKAVDQGIVHVYFTKLGVINLKQDVIYRWYELVSDFGGICGVFIGFSLISLVELAYFVVLFLVEFYRGPAAAKEPRDADEQIRQNRTAVQSIYWNELLPRSRIRVFDRERRNRY